MFFINSALWKVKLIRKIKHMRSKLVNPEVLAKRAKYGGKRPLAEKVEDPESPTKKSKVCITITLNFEPFLEVQLVEL